MVFILVISIIVLGLIFYTILKNKNFNVYKELKTSFNDLYDIHPRWSIASIKDINSNLSKLNVISNEKINEIIKVFDDNKYLNTDYFINEEDKGDNFEYNITLVNKCDDFSIELNLLYNKDKDDDVIFYNINKSSIMVNTKLPMYWYKYSLSYVNNDDITIKSYIYMRNGENNFIEVPMTIKANVFPYELKTKNGTMNFKLK